MTKEEATMVIEMMSALPYFPSAPGAHALIGDELQRMCPTAERGVWLVRRMSQLFGQWAGLEEMRAAYCGTYKPLDGREAISMHYPDGIPSERSAQQILLGAPPVGSEAAQILESVTKGLEPMSDIMAGRKRA